MLKRRNSSTLNVSKGLLLILIIFTQNVFAQPFTEAKKEILVIQDTRDYKSTEKLKKYLKDHSSEEHYTAMIAAASLGDTSLVDLLGELLHNKSNNYYMAPWALGFLNTERSRNYLVNSLNRKSFDYIWYIITALGYIGYERSFEELLNYIPFDNEEDFSALAIARYGMRKIKNEKSFLKLAEIFSKSTSFNPKEKVAYAFNRIGDKTYLLPYKDILIELSVSTSSNTRMWSFSALGKLQDTSDIEYLISSLEKDNDWRVRVNVCIALGNYKIDLNSPLLDKVTSTLLEHALRDASTHVSITAWQALGRLFDGVDTRNPLMRKVQQEIMYVVSPSVNSEWQIKAEAIKTYAKLFKDEAKQDLFTLFSTLIDYNLKAAIASSFGYMNDAMVYKELRDSLSNDVMRYNTINPNKDGSMIGSDDLAKLYKGFVEALVELDDRLDDENRNIIRLILSEFSASKNAAITDICLTNLQDSIYLQYRDETGQVMMFDYMGFVYPKDKDVMLMFIGTWDALKYEGAIEVLKGNLKHEDYDIAKASADALKNITGKEHGGEINAPKYRTDHDWSFFEKYNEKNTFAVVKTNRGDIKIRLWMNAPFTFLNFVKLAESGFYNNTIFHRVLPNFVIQGGDPTGTGYGGPGYSIRSEFSLKPFEGYTIGMASSGKDTEGSQFFITHSPQYHLDGKYTLFGTVVDGKDVVDKIQIGDRIESITIETK
jgi:cyclophilin family peptidyl-prolyl cis-trans isomerase/HEAT repeat protein